MCFQKPKLNRVTRKPLRFIPRFSANFTTQTTVGGGPVKLRDPQAGKTATSRFSAVLIQYNPPGNAHI